MIRAATYLLLFAVVLFFVAALIGFDRTNCALAIGLACSLLGLLSTIKPHQPRTVWEVLRRYQQL